MDAILIPVGEEWHALELARVQEVLPAPPIMPLPAGPAWLIGLINRRGQLLPVIDTGAPFQTAEGGSILTHVAVADTAQGVVAVAASGSPEPVALGEPAGSGDHPASLGRYLLGERVVTLVSLEAVVGGN